MLIGESEDLAARIAYLARHDEHEMENMLLMHELCSLPATSCWPLLFDPEQGLTKLIALLQESIDHTTRLNAFYEDSIFALMNFDVDTTALIDQFAVEPSAADQSHGQRSAMNTASSRLGDSPTSMFRSGRSLGDGGGVILPPSMMRYDASARSMSSGDVSEAFYNYKQQKPQQRSMSLQSSLWETSTSVSTSQLSRPQTTHSSTNHYHTRSGRQMLDSLVMHVENESEVLRLPRAVLEMAGIGPPAPAISTAGAGGDSGASGPAASSDNDTRIELRRPVHYKHDLCIVDWSDEQLDGKLLAAAVNGHTVLVLNCERSTAGAGNMSRFVEMLVARDFLVDTNTNKEYIHHEPEDILIHPRFKIILHVEAPAATIVASNDTKLVPPLIFKRLSIQYNAAHMVLDLRPSRAYMTSDAIDSIMDLEKSGYGTQKALAERLMLDAKAGLRERQQQLCDKLETIDFGQLVQPATLDYLRFLNARLKEKLELMNESNHIE